MTDSTTRDFYRLAIDALVDYDEHEPDRMRAASATIRIAEYRVVVTESAFDAAPDRPRRLSRLMQQLTNVADDASRGPDVLGSVHRLRSLVSVVSDCVGA